MVKSLISPSSGAPLELVADRPRPVPQRNEVLVRNHAFALNPVDWKQAKYGMYLEKFPVVLGKDFAGVVEEVGEGVTRWNVGDRVFGFPTVASGAWSELVIAPEHLIGKIPDDMSFEEASTLNFAPSTSAVALYEDFKLPLPHEHKVFDEPEYILIWGGASSTGTYAVQFATLSGLTVIAVASSKHHTYLKSLGAAHVLDYKDPDVVARIREITGGRLRLAYSTVSTETAELAAQALDQEAETHLAYLTPDKPRVGEKVRLSRTFSGHILHDDAFATSFYTEYNSLIQARKVVPNRIEVLSGGFASVADGIARLERGVSGVKLVVKLEAGRDWLEV